MIIYGDLEPYMLNYAFGTCVDSVFGADDGYLLSYETRNW